MKTAAAWRVGAATHPGLHRTTNEDRILVDETSGVFLIVDGLGGHAAGDTAAETAVRVISEHVEAIRDGAEDGIRSAITEANNQIYALSRSRDEWHGMACVLTLALLDDDRVTIGHVGDSRLYLMWNGHLTKLTSDHSPVGEQEDHGGLTEREAMRHPRRNEVFRDVGSVLREPRDPQFIDVRNFAFHPDAALLLCSDGLSDLLTSSEISAVVEHYNGDADSTARQLVERANRAGGTDNVSVVFVAGPAFIGTKSNTLLEVRSRHAVTRMRSGLPRWKAAGRNALWLLGGILIGILIWAALERVTPRQPVPNTEAVPEQRPTGVIVVSAEDPNNLANAVGRAVAGDIVNVPAGEFWGPIQLKEGVAIVAEQPGTAVIRINLASDHQAEAGIVSRHVEHARLDGLRIVGDDAHPLRTGIQVEDSDLRINDVDISGAQDSGINIAGASRVNVIGSFVHDNHGAGFIVRDTSVARLVGNTIEHNGNAPDKLRSGVEIESDAKPELLRNIIRGNGRPVSGSYSDQFGRAVAENNDVSQAAVKLVQKQLHSRQR